MLVDVRRNDKDRGGRAPFHMMQTPFIEDLSAAGFPPESIDLVLCTHLHVDHVGWNTRLDAGRWAPTFPRARYLFARREWEHWSAERDPDTQRIMADSVKPVLDAGLEQLVEMDHKLTDEICKIDAKLGAFENNEIDKRLQLEVRVTRIEKHVGISTAA
jgi:hypothetical protein